MLTTQMIRKDNSNFKEFISKRLEISTYQGKLKGYKLNLMNDD